MASTLISIIKRDHHSVETLWSEFKCTTDAEKKQQIAYHIIRELSIHTTCEEEVLYPLLRKKYAC
jgi:hemerythrin superfamily protein